MKVGIFDSGVGGLTVYKTLKKRYLFCDFIYFADTAHLPYGDKSKKTIISYSSRIVDFLLKKKCDLIVCACNTASSVALPVIRKQSPVPVYGVIESAADAVRSLKKVAVIGTKLTIRSGAYERAILRRKKSIKLFARPAALLAPIVEEGWADTEVCRRAIEIYLADIKKWKPQALILACTHYPLLKKQFSRYLGASVKLIDSSSIVKTLDAHIAPSKRKGKSSFFVSDDPEHFSAVARDIMGLDVGKVKLCTKYL